MSAIALKAATLSSAIPVLGGSHLAEALRTLENMALPPAGHLILQDFSIGGAYLVIDPNARTMEPGANYAFQWTPDRRPMVDQLWWTEARNGRPSRWLVRTPFIPEGSAAVSGDHCEASFRQYAIGKVVGILCNRDGTAMARLWAEGEGRNAKTLAPDTLPAQYRMVCDGNCLMPVFPSGTKFEFSRAGRRTVGSYVAVWRQPDLTPAGQHQAMVKRLLTPVPRRWSNDNPYMPPVVIVETLNPRRSYVVPLDQVAAVHKCEGAAQ